MKTHHVSSTPNLRELLSKLFIGTDDNVPGIVPPRLLIQGSMHCYLFIYSTNIFWAYMLSD